MMRHGRVDHFAVAEQCRAHPGEWLPVGEYNSRQSAQGLIGSIHGAVVRNPGLRSAYSPVGSFEDRQSLTEFGARVEARYIGISADVAWADAVGALIGGAA